MGMVGATPIRTRKSPNRTRMRSPSLTRSGWQPLYKRGMGEPPWHTHLEGPREGDLVRAWTHQCYCGSLANLCLVFLFSVTIKYKLGLVSCNSVRACVGSFDLISFGFRKASLEGCVGATQTRKIRWELLHLWQLARCGCFVYFLYGV